ncbi:hypothetical protein HY837_04605 [archaeon]|nr:hypothetical protein [archaeon]
MLHLLIVFDEEQKEVKKRDWHKIILSLFVILSISISGFILYAQFYDKTGMVALEGLTEVKTDTQKEDKTQTESELRAKINSLENKLTDLKNTYKNEVLGLLNQCTVESTSEGKTSCNEICYGIGPRKTCVNAITDGKLIDCSSQQEGKIMCTCCKTE